MLKFESLEDLQLNKSREYLDLIKGDDKFTQSCISDNRIKQIDLYCLLKSKFGSPNGFNTFLRGNHTNNFIQWDYSFEIGKSYLDILGSTRFLEFRFISKDEEIKKIKDDKVIEVFKKEILDNWEQIKKEKSGLEFWDMFINTYKRIKTTIQNLYEEYSKYKIVDPVVLKQPLVTRKELDTYSDQLEILTKAITEKCNYGLVLRMLIPVMGEALVNMLIFLLLKKDIKEDKRLLESVFRTQIDIRIKTMHLNCIGLKGPYDQNDNRFKNYLRIMNKRNDFLHGNIMPAVNCFEHVYFDGKIPIFENERDITVEFMKQKLFQIDDSTIDKEYSDIKAFEEFMVDNVEKGLKPEIISALESSDLGFNKKDNHVGVLFDDTLLQAFFIKD